MACHNPGYITASTVSPFLTGKNDKLLAGGITAAKKIAMERSGLVDIQNKIFEGNKYTEWGNEHEADAIRRYEEEQFVTVHGQQEDRKSTRLNSSHVAISYAVFCLKKNKKKKKKLQTMT